MAKDSDWAKKNLKSKILFLLRKIMPKSQRLAPFEVPVKPGGGLTFATPRQNSADYFFISAL